MSKVELDNITSGYNLSKINANFQKLEGELNDKVLYRQAQVGEPNSMSTDLDLNGHRVLNAVVGSSPGDLVTKGYVDQEVAEERAYANQELAKKFDKVGGPIFGSIQMQSNRITGLPSAMQPSEPATYAQLQAVESVEDSLIRDVFEGPDNTGLNNFYGGGGWTGSDSAFWNFYPGNAGANSITNALRWRYSVPATNNPSPVVWVEKKSSVTREDGVQRWDSGAIYGGLIKESGTAFGAAITGAVKYSGGTGDAVAMHGRVLSQTTGSSGFAGWFMHSAAASGVARAVAVEMDVQNFNDQLLWRQTGGPGQYTVLNLTSSSGTHGVHEYIRVPGKPPESGQQAYTGIFIGLNTIFPTDANDNGEAMRIRGSSFSSGRYGGIAMGDAFDSHFMSFGLRMINAQFTSNRAIQMADGHRIYWGASLGTGSGKWIEGLAGNLLNCQNLAIAMNGTKVVGVRRVGWTQSSGTASRAGFQTSTATTTQVAEALKALIDDLLAHGLIGA